jgi:putative nucleotidyltransferase with HDIG domain
MAAPLSRARSGSTRQLRRQLVALHEIGIALSGERDLNRLLELILTQGRRLTTAEAGSAYIRRQGRLWFAVSQNAKPARRRGASRAPSQNRPESMGESSRSDSVALDTRSLAGYVGLTGRLLNIRDAYHLPASRPYRFDPKFDEQNHYRTISVIVVPMKDIEGQLIGVLQLINARKGGRIVPFGREAEKLVSSLASQAAVAIKNALLAQDLMDAQLDTIFRLSVAAEYKDKATALHLRRMSRYTAVIAEELGLSPADVDLVSTAALLHDIGKIGVPDSILMKSGQLTADEMHAMQEHTTLGSRILANATAPLLRVSEIIALTHHEKWDGTGYPRGLRQDEIPLEGRIVAVADVFDALTSERCYKDAFPLDQAVQTIEADSGRHFDPRVVRAFLKGLPRIDQIRTALGAPAPSTT